jgi:hypothetical protein
LPHATGQSLSVVAVGADRAAAVAGRRRGDRRAHALELAAAARAVTSAVHAMPSSQVVGHAPGPAVMPGSHTSPKPSSTTPLPQVNRQVGAADRVGVLIAVVAVLAGARPRRIAADRGGASIGGGAASSDAGLRLSPQATANKTSAAAAQAERAWVMSLPR